MDSGDKKTERALATALGKPKYHIDTPGLSDDKQYFWFPTLGDSMTDNTPRSIPSGSLVLGYWFPITGVQDIPLHQPIVIIIDDAGEQFCMLKCVCRVIATDVDSEICLRSYNPAPRCDDFWLPFSCIKFVFIVERVRRPDGTTQWLTAQ